MSSSPMSRPTRLEALAKSLGGKSFAVKVDVRDRASIDRMVETVVERLGGIDILVNNAAVFDMQPILEITEASFDRQFAINVKGLLFTLQAVAAQMVAPGPWRQDHQHGLAGRPSWRGPSSPSIVPPRLR